MAQSYHVPLSLKDRLARYRLRIDVSRRWREQEGFDDLWCRMVDMYRGRHFETMSKDDQIAVNIAFATINVIGPTISTSHPKTFIYARDSEDAERAIIAEAVLDYWWKSKEIGVKAEFERAVDDFLMVGHGWLKTGYRYTEKPQKLGDEEMTDQFAQARAQADQYASENPEMAHTVPTDDEIMANLPDTRQVVDEDRPFAERVSFRDVFVDPEGTSTMDIKWIAQRIVRPIEDVKHDKRYDAAARNKVKGELSINAKWIDEQGKDKKYGDDIKRVTVWEFYDLCEGTLSIFAEGGDRFLVKPTKMPYRFGHPFVMLRNYEVPDQFYPMGDLEALEPLQRELNKTRSQLMKMRSQFARKTLYIEDAFGSAGRAALESKEDEWVPVLAGTDHKLSEIVQPAPTNSPAPELYQHSADIIQHADLVTGVSDYQRGTAPEIRRTATEASMIQDAANARAQHKLSIIEGVIADVGANLLCLARQYLTGDHVARIIGRAGKPIWVPYTQDDLDFEADFEVEGGSTMPKNEAYKQQQVSQLLQALSPLIGSVIDPVAVARFALQNFGVKNPESFIVQAVPGMPGMPGMPQDPNAVPPDGMAPPQQEGPPPPEGAGGDGPLDPAILAQLAGQVGLNLGQ